MKKITENLIEDKESKKLPTIINYSLLPNPELIDLAKQFSDKYESLSTGHYASDNSEYNIKYSEKIRDKVTDEIVNTAARVSHTTGVIELDKSMLKNKEYTSDFVFFIIIWCASCYELENLAMADKAVIGYYLTTGRSKKNLMLGYIKLFSSNIDLNKERLELIRKMLGE